MNKFALSALSVLLFLASHCPSEAAGFKGKVVTIIDGDSMVILNGQTPTKLILYAIDCPEATQDAGAQAREFTYLRCYKRDVTVEEHGLDHLGRTIAEVFLEDGSSLNKALVSNGLAWWTKKYAPEAIEYKQLEQTARQAKKGLWVAAEPIPPWIFRNGKRTRDVQAVIKTK